jgi:predicted nucleic acid-binding protein
MNTTFVDASFLFAYLLTDDANHQRARAWELSVAGRLLTTEYALIERDHALQRSYSLDRASLNDIMGKKGGDYDVSWSSQKRRSVDRRQRIPTGGIAG